MNRIGFVLALLAVVLFGSYGCETMRDSWDKTQEFYKRYVNVDPEIELETGELDPARYKLARLFAPLDQRIEQVSRKLDATDSFPDDKWFDEIFAQFGWLSGVLVVDLSGEILKQEPETAMKPLEIDPLIEEQQELWDRLVRADIQDSELGPEIYLSTPFFHGADLSGVVSVHFDMRNLIEFSPNPDELVIFTPEIMLWTGKHADAEALLDMPWADILKDDVSGEAEAGGKEFIWVSRFMGEKKIIYAVEKPAEE